MNDIDKILPHIKLRFNIEHPTFEECYAHGYECAKAEIGEEANPFPVNTPESEQWLEGWWAGFYGEMPLYELPELLGAARIEPQVATNDQDFSSQKTSFFKRVLEITGVIAVSTVLGYQVIDLVA